MAGQGVPVPTTKSSEFSFGPFSRRSHCVHTLCIAVDPFAAVSAVPERWASLEATKPPGGELDQAGGFLTGSLEGPGSPALSLIRAAATNEDAARMLREFLEQGFLTTAERHLDATHPRRRLALCGSHLIGLVFGRTILEVPELAEPGIEDLVAVVAPTIQRYLTEELGWEQTRANGRPRENTWTPYQTRRKWIPTDTGSSSETTPCGCSRSKPSPATSFPSTRTRLGWWLRPRFQDRSRSYRSVAGGWAPLAPVGS